MLHETEMLYSIYYYRSSWIHVEFQFHQLSVLIHQNKREKCGVFGNLLKILGFNPGVKNYYPKRCDI